MTKFIVSYYQRNPLDEQDRWTIKRDTINADSKAEAGDIIAECDCEVIKVETAEELYNQIEVLKAELKSADEGLRLFHSIASNGEQSVLSRLDNGVDAVDAQRWQDEQIEKAGRQDESGGESVDVSQYFNGYKATATKEWAKRHLNGGE